MFYQPFNPKYSEKYFVIQVNDHKIECDESSASKLSSTLYKYLEANKLSTKFTIEIPELIDLPFFTPADYIYLDKIFLNQKILITENNINIMKILDKHFVFYGLNDLLAEFDSIYELVSQDQTISILKEYSSMFRDINESSIDALLEKSVEFEKYLNDGYLYNLAITTCINQTKKIELIINFLEKLEENTKGNQYSEFKTCVLFENLNSREIQYTIRYLVDKNEISFSDVFPKIVEQYNEVRDKVFHSCVPIFFYDLLDEFFIANPVYKNKNDTQYLTNMVDNNFSNLDCDLNEDDDDQQKSEAQKTGLFQNFNLVKNSAAFEVYYKDNWKLYKEMMQTGKNPDEEYEAIKSDDLALLTEIVQRVGFSFSFTSKINKFIFEKNTKIYENDTTLLDLCAFYGSEKCFDYVLMNGGIITSLTKHFSISGGNAQIIYKCQQVKDSQLYLNRPWFLFQNRFENDNIDHQIRAAIEFNQNEVLEWILEQKSDLGKEYLLMQPEKIIELSIKFNNFEALICFILMGINTQSLLSYSLLYNNFYFAKLSFSLSNKCKHTPIEFELASCSFETPIFIAIYKNQLEIVEKIINYPVGSCKNQVFESLSPLFFAVYHDKLDIFKLMINHQQFNKVNVKCNGIPLITFAYKYGKKDIFEYLLTFKSIKLDWEEDETLKKLIHYVVEKGDIKLVKYLVNERKVGINCFEYSLSNGRFSYPMTPLNYACYFNHIEIVKFLIEEKNAKYIYPGNKIQLIISSIIRTNNYEIFNYLYEKIYINNPKEIIKLKKKVQDFILNSDDKYSHFLRNSLINPILNDNNTITIMAIAKHLKSDSQFNIKALLEDPQFHDIFLQYQSQILYCRRTTFEFVKTLLCHFPEIDINIRNVIIILHFRFLMK